MYNVCIRIHLYALLLQDYSLNYLNISDKHTLQLTLCEGQLVGTPRKKSLDATEITYSNTPFGVQQAVV